MQWTENYFSYELEILKKLQKFTLGMKALDVGAGIGKCMISLEKSGFDAYGFEPSKPFYERAISIMNIRPEKIRLGKIEDIDYEKEYFDFITFGAVFEHLYHPAENLEKAFQWLKPQGLIQIEVPSSDYLISKIINEYYRLLGTNYVTNISPMHTPFHLYEFSLKSFKRLAERLKFEVVFHEYSVGGIPIAPKIFHPILRKIMHQTKTGMQLTVWLKKY
jgi:2-polyprenyl-3-methyl-5-hydroxy-6-metoxy-1,4-benzoquinol methylase